MPGFYRGREGHRACYDVGEGIHAVLLFSGTPLRRHQDRTVLALLKEKSLSPPIQGFPEMAVPQNGWFIIENPIKMGDFEVPRKPP